MRCVFRADTGTVQSHTPSSNCGQEVRLRATPSLRGLARPARYAKRPQPLVASNQHPWPPLSNNCIRHGGREVRPLHWLPSMCPLTRLMRRLHQTCLSPLHGHSLTKGFYMSGSRRHSRPPLQQLLWIRTLAGMSTPSSRLAMLGGNLPGKLQGSFCLDAPLSLRTFPRPSLSVTSSSQAPSAPELCCCANNGASLKGAASNTPWFVGIVSRRRCEHVPLRSGSFRL